MAVASPGPETLREQCTKTVWNAVTFWWSGCVIYCIFPFLCCDAHRWEGHLAVEPADSKHQCRGSRELQLPCAWNAQSPTDQQPYCHRSDTHALILSFELYRSYTNRHKGGYSIYQPSHYDLPLSVPNSSGLFGCLHFDVLWITTEAKSWNQMGRSCAPIKFVFSSQRKANFVYLCILILVDVCLCQTLLSCQPCPQITFHNKTSQVRACLAVHKVSTFMVSLQGPAIYTALVSTTATVISWFQLSVGRR